MAPIDVYDKIDEYLKIQAGIFTEVKKPVTKPNVIIEIIQKREQEAARQSPFPPNQAIFLQGVYAHFLQKWLEHYEMNKNIFVVDNSELADQPFNVMKNIESFLELSEFYQELGSTDLNPSRVAGASMVIQVSDLSQIIILGPSAEPGKARSICQAR